MHFLICNFFDFIQICQGLVVKSPVDNRSALIQVLAWGNMQKVIPMISGEQDILHRMASLMHT